MRSSKLEKTARIDWELKLLAAAMAYAVCKFLGKYTIFILFCRIFFGIAHLWFLVLFFNTRKDINTHLKASESKIESNAAVFSIFKSISIKAVIVLLAHLKTGMLPPLIISSFMGLYSILETKEYNFSLQRRNPFLVEKD